MKHLNVKTVICILASLILVGSVSVGLTACKKDDAAETTKSSVREVSTTEPLTPEQRAEMEKQLEKDDNVVEDPFGDDESGSGSNKKAEKSDSKETTAAKKSDSKQTTTAAKSDSKKSTTTAKSDSKKTTKAAKKSTKKSGGSALVTDENGNLWTGWY
ncbi:MAG: hypothetical protein IKE65_09360 [Clostridia bacterium]|nr:hypothetical protein [Clostridia bacterium]